MIYLHIPFCVRKCKYCDFLSGAYSGEIRRAYLEALRKEIRVRCGALCSRSVSSIFIGGGTPSLLEPAQMKMLLDEVTGKLKLSKDAEITVEVNPGTVDREKLEGYLACGINRLSIGVQAVSGRLLELLGRIHSWEDFLKTYELARTVGFRNINLDLMSALPGQTLEDWKETLETVLSLQPLPEHLSVYSLILEEGTELYEMDRRGAFGGKMAIPDEETDREMIHMTGERLKAAGFSQYEISNYAREGFACRHNCGYWTRKEYLGLGIGAASLFGNCRYSNTTDLQEYIKAPLEGRIQEELSRNAQIEETVFLGLRMNRGVDKQAFQETYGVTLEKLYGSVIEKNVRDGLLENTETCIRLNERGRDLSNYVMAQFLL